MKATEAGLLGFLRKSPQFVIPIYQRTYSWTYKECRQIWEDIIRTGNNDEISVHFIGSIVYIESGLSNVSHQEPLLVIDGQQRLTTLTLLISALANALEDTEPVDGFSMRKLRNYYLVNPEETGERYFKLMLSQTDKTTLNRIVSDDDQPDDRSVRVMRNYGLFEELIAGCNGDFTAVCNGLAKLVVVDIALNRDQDNPQLIFESMNSTGRELTQADLIRNFILMGLEPAIQTRLYEQFWRPMELAFGQEAYVAHFDAFMRHYLTVKTGEIPRLNEVYESFKEHARSPQISEAGIEVLVKDIRDFARYFCAITLGNEADSELNIALHDLRELKVDVAFPLLLELYHDYATGALPRADFEEAIRLVESYVFRRAICAVPTNSMNKTFATFARTLKKDRYLESIKASFLALRSYRRFPRDDEFKRDMQTRDLYNFRSRSYWLRRFENHGRKEHVAVHGYTIEHIMPQNEALSEKWKEALGSEWERVHQSWLHTLGNLTLTGYNSEYSDRPFLDKRDMEGGFGESPIRLNGDLRVCDKWDENAIKTRAAKLAAMAPSVWIVPGLSKEILEAYSSKAAESGDYSIADHPDLLTAHGSQLFEAFREEVLALDPCISEEFFQLYVAYKAETNFVDVVPEANQLRLSLNMRFAEISDPKGLCKDVSTVGRWGNGDVEVPFNSLDELPYVIGLVRQSLEQQLGSEETG